jgi:hypothetical protein
MTMNNLIKAICMMEGKKVQVSVGNVREVLRCLNIIEASFRIAEAEKENQPISVVHAMRGPVELLSVESLKIARKEFAKRKRKKK